MAHPMEAWGVILITPCLVFFLFVVYPVAYASGLRGP